MIWGLGCSRGGGPELRVPDGTPIVLISVDTLRSDRLPAYGYGGVETPAIDQLRRDGVLFERAYTNVPLTLPAHTSLLTGLLPPDHGVRDNLGYTVDAAKTPLLQQALKEAGYDTGAAVSAYALRRTTKIGTGFDLYDDDMEVAAGAGPRDMMSVQRLGGETLNVVRPWLRSVADRPFFLFFHIFEPHTPYEPPPKYAARYPSPYDGEVAAADDVIGDLLDELRGLDVYDRALIVFLSDHGEDLGDHGEGEHGLFLYRSTLQVPLIIKLPQAERAGETIGYPVQLIDVYPTLVSAIGLPHPENLPGTPLLARQRPDPGENPIYAETFFPRLHFGWSDLAALITDRYHFIDAPRPELYDLLQDPDERDNMFGSQPVLETEFRTALSGYDRRLEEPEATDPETRRRLEALGYVGGASTSEDDVLPDPKDRVHWMADIQRAYRLFHDGDLESAVPAFQRILEENPKIEDAWGYLALAQLELGRPDEAAATFQGALEHLASSRRFSLSAARLLEHLGRLDEASVYANRAVPYDPPAAHLLLAQIGLRKGDFEGAETEAREAIASGDRGPGPRLILADVFLARGEPNRAIDLLTRTLEEGIAGDPVREKLAMTYAWVGDFDKARETLRGLEGSDKNAGLMLTFGRLAMSRQLWGEARGWFERALLVDPINPTVKLNLGLIAMNEGRLDDARKYLQEAVAGNLDSFEGWSALGMVFARQGDPGGAIIAWERARKINSGNIEILYNLGIAHAQVGNLSQAIGYLEDYAAHSQPSPRRDQALTMAQKLRLQAS
jgi:arylsulfatase A-like enzyme/Tfp pilus assembly protein PilF